MRFAGPWERRRLRLENQRYRLYLEAEVQSRTADLQHQTTLLQEANHKLGAEIDDHRRTEQALRRSQNQLADVISIFEGFIYAVDKLYRLGFMNPRLLGHLGVHRAEGICQPGHLWPPKPLSLVSPGSRSGRADHSPGIEQPARQPLVLWYFFAPNRRCR